MGIKDCDTPAPVNELKTPSMGGYDGAASPDIEFHFKSDGIDEDYILHPYFDNYEYYDDE